MSGPEQCERCGSPLTERDRELGVCPVCTLDGLFSFDQEQPTGSDQFGVDVAAVGEDGAVGRFRLVEKLGEGGFGQVFLGEQTEPVFRRVAVKVLKEQHRSQFALSRFELERQAVARLEHPNVCRLIEAGQLEDGRPYFAMEAIDGRPLDEYCTSEELGLRERLRLFLQVCEGVRHAHQRGVIHRDIKPSNILVTGRGEDVRPILVDFGVARGVDRSFSQDTLIAESKDLIGTPAYMSPEQADHPESACDVRSDVFALGAVLYELLVGDTPISRDDISSTGTVEILKRVAAAQFRPPSRLVVQPDPSSGWQATYGELRGDLDTIVMTALRKEPERRFQSVSAFAADIGAFLDRRPIRARKQSVPYRLQRWGQRNPWLVATIGVAIVALLVLWLQGQRRLGLSADRFVAQLLASPAAFLDAAPPDGTRGLVTQRMRHLVTDAGVTGDARFFSRLFLWKGGDEGQRDVLYSRLLDGGTVPPSALIPFLEHSSTGSPSAQTIDEIVRHLAAAAGRSFSTEELLLFAAVANARPADSALEPLATGAVSGLLAQQPVSIRAFAGALRPARDLLESALRKRYAAGTNNPVGTAIALAELYADNPVYIVDLIATGSSAQLEVLSGVIENFEPSPIPQLREFLARPLPPEGTDSELNRFAAGQARAAAILLRHSQSEALDREVWAFTRRAPGMADPRLRTELVRAPALSGLPVSRLIELLEVAEDPGELAAGLSALGFYSPVDFFPAQRAQVAELATSAYLSNADPEVHGTARWLLQVTGHPVPEFGVHADWGERRPQRLEVTKDAIAGEFVCIPGGASYLAGARSGERGAESNEVSTEVELDRSFAIGTHPVTIGLVRTLAPDLEDERSQKLPDSAVFQWVSLTSARAFCNAVSKADGIPEEGWAYDPESPHKPRGNWMDQPGYRLPAEGEWEYACRAGSTAPRPYGEEPDHLTDYYRVVPSGYTASSPRALLPNAFGLFEVLGGKYEWAERPFELLRTDPAKRKFTLVGARFDLGDGRSYVQEGTVLRSSLTKQSIAFFRSASRMIPIYPPEQPYRDATVRLARTLGGTRADRGSGVVR